ncbi:MAG: polyphosphate polymerase domain-containing protein [Oscillospiraceae bacterium]|nr:polyphosphate polymerase domain-containing protein [Oscillospiraceae bacterium]
MALRHELKHEISYADMLALRGRLAAVMRRDEHAVGGAYKIRSLYFDNVYDKALREKIDGVNMREKFRIRYYNGDIGFIQLEKKSKIGSLTSKAQARISAEKAQKIISGDLDWMKSSESDLVRELYAKMRFEGLRPRTIVDYTREPFIYAPGNVRVTLDYDIRTGLGSTDFLSPKVPTVAAGDQKCILEVKWDEYLPDVVRCAVQLGSVRAESFSKYAISRIYG